MNDETEIRIRKAIEKGELEELDFAVSELLQSKNISSHIDLLNELLLVNLHYQHQYIARTIQDYKFSSSVPFIDKVLESKFEGIPYTGSESRSMARWFSRALYCIGNEEAIEVMKKHTNSTDEGIREEMTYRLNKLDSAEN